MSKEQMDRRHFLKMVGAGALVAGAGALGSGVMVPTGLWAQAPKIKGPIKVGYQAVISGALAGYGEFHKMGATVGRGGNQPEGRHRRRQAGNGVSGFHHQAGRRH